MSGLSGLLPTRRQFVITGRSRKVEKCTQLDQSRPQFWPLALIDLVLRKRRRTPPAPFRLSGSRSFNRVTNTQTTITLTNIEYLPAKAAGKTRSLEKIDTARTCNEIWLD